MKSQNIYMKAWAEAERRDHARQLRNIKWRKRMKAGAEFLEGFHEYERTFSDEYVGEKRIMRGREAKELNDNLFQDYLAAVERNVEGRSLERWKVIKKFVEPTE